MKIDNSQMKTWHVCPWLWAEKYHHHLQKKHRNSDALSFGKRMHHLWEARLRYMRDDPPGVDCIQADACDAPFEAEAQAMFAAYEARYPVEEFDVVDVERYFEVLLPGSAHIYIGKFDGIVRAHDTGMLSILEHKTEKRGSKQNLPQAWAVRPQASLYIWAAEQLYGERFDQIILDVATRQSPAGEKECEFTRQNLQRTDEQKLAAVQNITWVADRIEEMLRIYGDGPWPFDGENCAPNNWKCDFHDLHIFGRTEELLDRDFEPAEEYLTL